MVAQVSFAAPKAAPAAMITSGDKTTNETPAATTNTTEPSISYALSETSYEDTKLVQATTLQFQNQKTELKPIAHGLRKKKFFGLVPVKVYVIEFLSANPTKLVKTDEGILASMKSAEAVELKITVKRDLGGKKITDSFIESLKNNGIDTANLSTEMAAILAELNTINEFKKGETFSLLATWKDANATLFIHKPDGSIKMITGPEKFAHDLFSIWFGTPADKEMIELKKTLLK